MAGIIGKLSFDPHETLARTAVEQMLDAVAADCTETRRLHIAPGIALGTCGLFTHPEPAHSEPVALNVIRIVVDGTITNVRALRQELSESGFACRDDEDSTVIGRAYEAWGDRCFERLDGPFACAIWDEGRRRLLLARDHVGIRHVYFALLQGHGLAFASTLAALFHDPGVSRECCAAGIDAYLTLGYVPSPLTAFRRISKLEPGQLIVIEGRGLHAEQFWAPTAPDVSMNEDEAVEELDARLRAAMGSDDIAPVLSSGGMASASLLAACRPNERGAITIAIDQTSSDVVRAHELALHLGHTPTVDVSCADTLALAAHVAASLEEPIADPSSVTQYAVCASASLHCDTAFTGHGAAALFGRAAPNSLWDVRRRRHLYTQKFASEVRGGRPASATASTVSSFRRRGDEMGLAPRAQLLLPGSTLALASHAALAAGIRLQFPFVTRPVMELAAALPATMKHGGDEGLPLLRRLLQRRVPSGMLADAAASAVPVWLRTTLSTLVPSVLLAHRFDARGIVNRLTLQSVWNEHCRGQHDHSLRLWSLLMLELWFRQALDGDATAEPTPYSLLKAA